ncbi:hypothetical protein SAY87_027249 [Trapa incisa]|uniref:Protein NUCLEAR FUSION DEFECTIVE 6, chloroplastic/mitochondrial-like n=1 Tax=Trapa incisa TaxID=236973 RepID=A0AAN7JM99_9MYRT|nr:hypothetical protein SAY87_027249 [Trapa incisa]
MASLASVRSIFRSASVRNAASKIASEAKVARSPFCAPTSRPASRFISRTPVEASACVESMMPYHTATSSALLTSMLSITRRTHGWLPEGREKTR